MKVTATYRGIGLAVATTTLTTSAHAGMTVYGLRDIYRLRFEEISFFIVMFLVCAFLLKLLWNYAFKEFTAMPRISYRQSLCASLLFGVMTLLILTMISGIREVLTPGAWRRQGTSYKLNDPSQEPARRRSLEHLRGALFAYASTHEGRFPSHDFGNDIVEKLWESPDQNGTRYIYTGGLTTNRVESLLAIEPRVFGDKRFVLRVSGDIEMLANEDIDRHLKAKVNP